VDPVPAAEGAPASSAARKPSPPPGAKRARHQRWTRATLLVTVLVLAVFAAAIAWVIAGWLRSSPEDERVEAARVLLSGIATQVGEYHEVYAHLPERLSQLRDPALPSPYESDPRDPWYSRIEFVPHADGKGFRLRSLGPDKAPGTPDDLVVEHADVAELRRR
jgi:hypothetical protein